MYRALKIHLRTGCRKIDKDKAWSKKEFEMAVSTFNGYKSRREFYEELLENQIYQE